MSLFNRGYDDLEQIEKEIEAKRSSNKVHRFWMPVGKTTRIVFLDDKPPVYEEHNPQINGSWKHWFTCNKMFGEPCSHCEAGTYAYTAGAYTIIDGTEWVDKKGKTHKNEKKLFVAKIDTLKKLKQISAKRGGLRGCVFEVSRTGDKSPGTGDMFDFEKKLSEEELKKLFGGQDGKGHEPYNYDEVLAPKDAEETNTQMNDEAKNQYEAEEDVNF
jgi:hypothetical protein